jgi:hypothetical protein
MRHELHETSNQKERKVHVMANEDYPDMMADGNNPDPSEDDEEDEDEEPDFDVTRYQVIASGDTFVRYDTFTGVSWILQSPGTPASARWVAVAEPEEDADD